ncbi:MAG: GNAT family N-acetyltransferase [Ruminococcaceae bacterium]|nr:GNAT family N-acetyltransferase [Oscillospiraceae bacterium]
MQVRLLDMTNTDEALAAARVSATAFRSPGKYRQLLLDLQKNPDLTFPDPRKGDRPKQHWGAFSDENLVAVSASISMHMRYESKFVPLCGVADVATLPEYRRQGAIRLIMGELLRQAEREGHVFSYLFPFSFAFYGKFGYSQGCRRYHVELPMEQLTRLKEIGSVRACKQGDADSLQTIYDRFTRDCNGAVLRSDVIWAEKCSRDRWSEQFHTYIWQNEQGQDCAYMTYETIAGKAVDVLHIQDWACSTPESIIGLLAFLTRYASQYAKVTMNVPCHMNLSHYFPEPRLLRHTREISGQIRVIRIAEALTRLHQPDWLRRELAATAVSAQDHWLSLLVTDEFLPENSGLYRLSLAETVPVVQHLADPSPDSGYDLRIDARILSTLLLGSQGLEELAGHPECQIHPEMNETRRKLLYHFFPQKKHCIYDYF